MSASSDEVLVLVLERRELAAFEAALALVEHELGDGERLANMRLAHRYGSPWLECAAVVTTLPRTTIAFDELAEHARAEVEHARVVRLALWRRTGDVYRLDEHGAVGEDPIYRPEDG